MVIEQSDNIKQGMDVYLKRLKHILAAIKKGCKRNGKNDFENCGICHRDYSVQFHDVSLTMLREDGIISKKTEEEIKSKLYDGHRG